MSPKHRDPTDPANLEAVRLLQQAIAASGLSVRQYATRVLIRSPRNVQRWLAVLGTGGGKAACIPQPVVAFLTREANFTVDKRVKLPHPSAP